MATNKVPKFNAKDSVLCNHGPLLYRARVLEVKPSEERPDEFSYLVHYEGWKSRWDDWVTEDRVLEINEDNLKLQKERLEAEPSQKKKKRASGMVLKDRDGVSSRPSTPSIDGSKQRSSRASTGSDYEPKRKKPHHMQQHVETQAQYFDKPEVKVKMPDDLKPLLVDDWDFVTRQYKLVTLPARRTVRQILDDYVKFKSAAKGVSATKLSLFEEAAHGIREYFNVMLGTQLLYKFERLQYSELVAQQSQAAQHGQAARMSDFYGFSHLLRLFVRLGNMLVYTKLGEENIKMIMPYVQDILKYLQRNQASLFNFDDYFISSPEYQRTGFS